MTWLYASDFTLARDRVRLLIGDTDVTDPLVTDEEIAVYTTGVLAQPNDYLAAASVCDVIAGKMARRVDMSTGSSSVSLSQQATAYERKARELRRRSATQTSPFVGGVSISGKNSREGDTDRTVAAFTRQMGDTGSSGAEFSR